MVREGIRTLIDSGGDEAAGSMPVEEDEEDEEDE